MSDNVIVPIKLEVTDIDLTKNLDMGAMEKDITQQLQGLKSAVQNVFSNIDTSKLSGESVKAISSVQKAIQNAEKAQIQYNRTMESVGKSTQVYKDAKANLGQYEQQLEEAKNKLAEFGYSAKLKKFYGPNAAQSEKDFKNSPEFKESLNHYTELKQKIKEYKEILARPETAAFTAEESGIQRISVAYTNLINSIGTLNRAVEGNKMSGEYQEAESRVKSLQGEMEKLKEKAKKMAEVGASDKQWASLQYDAENLNNKIKDTTSEMQKMVKSGSAFTFGGNPEQIQQQLDEIRRMRKEAGGSKGAINQTANANRSQYSAEYEEELKNFQKIEQAIDKLNAKYKELQALGKLTPDGLAKMKYEAEQLQGQLETSKGKLTEMVNNGSAFRLGQGDTESELSGINARIDESSQKLNEVNGASANMATNLQTANTVIQGLSKTVNKVAKGLLQCVTGAILFGKQGKSTGNSIGKIFKKLQRSLMMYGFGFRTVYYAIKRLRTLFIQEFKLMAQQSGEINEQVTSLTMSFNRLKGSLATAFQPLASVVIPILKTAMDYLSNFLESIGRFFATLTGQSYIFKAVARNIDSVGESAEKAKNQLGSYDKLDVISKDTESDAGSDLGIDYEKVGIEGGSNFAQLIKEAWENQDFTEVGQTISRKLVEALNSVEWGAIREKAKGIANSVATLINGFFSTAGLGQSVGNTIANALGTGIDFAYKLLSTLDFEQAGQTAADVVNQFLTKMAEVDETGLDSWAKLAESYSRLVRGMLGLITTAIEETDWEEVGRAIGEYISNIDWGGVIMDFASLVGAIVKGIAAAIKGWAGEDPISLAIAGLITAVVGTINLAGLLLPLVIKGKVLKEFLGMAKTIKGGGASGAGDAAKSIGDAATESGKVSSATSKLSTKLGSLAKNLALGIVILVELAAAAIIFVAAIWAIGKLLEEVGIAWEPVIANGDTITTAILVGTGLLIGIGVVTAALGAATIATGPALPVAIGLGTAMLVLLAEAFIIFCDELINVANQLIELSEPFAELNGILPDLKDDMNDFTKFMGNFAGAVVAFTTTSAIAGIAATIDKVIGFFTTDPVQHMCDEVTDQTGEFENLISALEIINPLIEEATDLVGIYKDNMGSFEDETGGTKGFLNSIVQGGKNVVNGLIGLFEGMANGVIKCINAIIRGLNKISIDVPDWVEKLTGMSTFGFNIKEISTISIPRLAQGAVIPPNKEFLAVLGDQKRGTNIEAPLDTIKQALAEVMANYGGGSNSPIILQLDGETVAKVVWDEQAKYYKQTGKYSPAY